MHCISPIALLLISFDLLKINSEVNISLVAIMKESEQQNDVDRN